MARSTTLRAFTLIELLVSVAIVTVLLGILLPSLGRARSQSRQLKSLTNTRALAAIVGQYQNSNKEYFPRIIQNKWYHTVDGIEFIFPFWQISTTWVAVVVDYMPSTHYQDLVHCPLSRRDENLGFGMTSYHYSWSFVCPSAYWKRELPDASVVRRGVKLADVLYPSSKALLWDEDAGYLRSQLTHIDGDLSAAVPMVLADGSGHVRRPSNANAAVFNLEVPTRYPIRLLATENGVRGTDY